MFLNFPKQCLAIISWDSITFNMDMCTVFGITCICLELSHRKVLKYILNEFDAGLIKEAHVKIALLCMSIECDDFSGISKP